MENKMTPKEALDNLVAETNQTRAILKYEQVIKQALTELEELKKENYELKGSMNGARNLQNEWRVTFDNLTKKMEDLEKTTSAIYCDYDNCIEELDNLKEKSNDKKTSEEAQQES